MALLHWQAAIVCLSMTMLGVNLGLYYHWYEPHGTDLDEACKPAALLDAAGAVLAKSMAQAVVQLEVDGKPHSDSASASGSVPGPVIERGLETQLRRVCYKQTGKYYMVVGPRGIGKSVTATVATGKRDGLTVVPCEGSLRVIATHNDGISTIMSALAPSDSTGPAYAKLVDSAILFDLDPLCKAAAKHYKNAHPEAPDDWVPTIVIEMDRNLTRDDMAAICRTAKWLACEINVAAVVLVLSDTRTGGIPTDLGRQVCMCCLLCAVVGSCVAGCTTFAQALRLARCRCASPGMSWACCALQCRNSCGLETSHARRRMPSWTVCSRTQVIPSASRSARRCTRAWAPEPPYCVTC